MPSATKLYSYRVCEPSVAHDPHLAHSAAIISTGTTPSPIPVLAGIFTLRRSGYRRSRVAAHPVFVGALLDAAGAAATATDGYGDADAEFYAESMIPDGSLSMVDIILADNMG
ncbi:uncharacterized protein B0H18DRAFT_955816 [Fomitopsis serialis]|uniref:uncharacterized protein n=1 Tax=Fomitopsis serialis TaxID=139415 RepID=UPI0020074068|nr:uncharacterized protein B0H18DRAFT_955816 [Neoantrodia serialis]KAH9923490.1 hypothetical protein B0H18DRAFT_955816 [Neoantrodia serialis]